MLGQRWEYRIGNSVVLVDNAFAWTGWTQERLLVNGDTVREAGGWFAFYRGFDESWLTQLGEGKLRAVLRSRMRGIACTVTLDGAVQEPIALWEARWSGGPSQRWPAEVDWTEARGNKWMA
jgi:hypothetical protein